MTAPSSPVSATSSSARDRYVEALSMSPTERGRQRVLAHSPRRDPSLAISLFGTAAPPPPPPGEKKKSKRGSNRVLARWTAAAAAGNSVEDTLTEEENQPVSKSQTKEIAAVFESSSENKPIPKPFSLTAPPPPPPPGAPPSKSRNRSRSRSKSRSKPKKKSSSDLAVETALDSSAKKKEWSSEIPSGSVANSPFLPKQPEDPESTVSPRLDQPKKKWGASKDVYSGKISGPPSLSTSQNDASPKVVLSPRLSSQPSPTGLSDPPETYNVSKQKQVDNAWISSPKDEIPKGVVSRNPFLEQQKLEGEEGVKSSPVVSKPKNKWNPKQGRDAIEDTDGTPTPPATSPSNFVASEDGSIMEEKKFEGEPARSRSVNKFLRKAKASNTFSPSAPSPSAEPPGDRIEYLSPREQKMQQWDAENDIPRGTVKGISNLFGETKKEVPPSQENSEKEKASSPTAAAHRSPQEKETGNEDNPTSPLDTKTQQWDAEKDVPPGKVKGISNIFDDSGKEAVSSQENTDADGFIVSTASHSPEEEPLIEDTFASDLKMQQWDAEKDIPRGNVKGISTLVNDSRKVSTPAQEESQKSNPQVNAKRQSSPDDPLSTGGFDDQQWDVETENIAPSGSAKGSSSIAAATENKSGETDPWILPSTPSGQLFPQDVQDDWGKAASASKSHDSGEWGGKDSEEWFNESSFGGTVDDSTIKTEYTEKKMAYESEMIDTVKESNDESPEDQPVDAPISVVSKGETLEYSASSHSHKSIPAESNATSDDSGNDVAPSDSNQETENVIKKIEPTSADIAPEKAPQDDEEVVDIKDLGTSSSKRKKMRGFLGIFGRKGGKKGKKMDKKNSKKTEQDPAKTEAKEKPDTNLRSSKTKESVSLNESSTGTKSTPQQSQDPALSESQRTEKIVNLSYLKPTLTKSKSSNDDKEDEVLPNCLSEGDDTLVSNLTDPTVFKKESGYGSPVKRNQEESNEIKNAQNGEDDKEGLVVDSFNISNGQNSAVDPFDLSSPVFAGGDPFRIGKSSNDPVSAGEEDPFGAPFFASENFSESKDNRAGVSTKEKETTEETINHSVGQIAPSKENADSKNQQFQSVVTKEKQDSNWPEEEEENWQTENTPAISGGLDNVPDPDLEILSSSDEEDEVEATAFSSTQKDDVPDDENDDTFPVIERKNKQGIRSIASTWSSARKSARQMLGGKRKKSSSTDKNAKPVTDIDPSSKPLHSDSSETKTIVSSDSQTSEATPQVALDSLVKETKPQASLDFSPIRETKPVNKGKSISLKSDSLSKASEQKHDVLDASARATEVMDKKESSSGALQIATSTQGAEQTEEKSLQPSQGSQESAFSKPTNLSYMTRKKRHERRLQRTMNTPTVGSPKASESAVPKSPRQSFSQNQVKTVEVDAGIDEEIAAANKSVGLEKESLTMSKAAQLRAARRKRISGNASPTPSETTMTSASTAGKSLVSHESQDSAAPGSFSGNAFKATQQRLRRHRAGAASPPPTTTKSTDSTDPATAAKDSSESQKALPPSILKKPRRGLPPAPDQDRDSAPTQNPAFGINLGTTDPVQIAGLRLLSAAVIPIQAMIRGFLGKKRAIRRMNAIIAAQSYARRWNAEANLQNAVIAATIIQSAYRGWVDRQVYDVLRQRKENDCAVIIQSYMRRWLAEKKLFETLYAVIKIQAAFRGWSSRDQLDDQNFCATQIQRIVRGYLATVSVYEDIYKVTLVQSFVRMKLATEEAIYRMAFIIQVQSIIRGYLTRRDIEKKADAALAIQTAWRCHDASIKYQFVLLDVITVQSFYRQRVAKKKAANIRKVKQNAAATMIQTRWRSYDCSMNYLHYLADILIVQSVVRRYFAKRKLQNAAAIQIQRAWRGFVAFSDYMFSVADIVIVQTRARRLIANRKVSLLRENRRNAAATTVQRIWRGHRDQEDYLNKFLSAVIIQSAARRFMSQKNMKLTREEQENAAATIIQRNWRCFWDFSTFVIMLDSAIRIQSLARRHLARNLLKKQKESAVVIQTASRGYIVRKQVNRSSCISPLEAFALETGEQEAKAAASIQKWVRGGQARFAFKFFLKVRLIQTVWRGHTQKKSYQEIRAARKIQTLWRGIVARREYAKLRDTNRAAVLFQNAWRRYVCYTNFTCTRAAVRIQKSWRGFVCYTDFIFTVGDIVMAQRIARGYLARRQLKELKEQNARELVAIEIQRHYRGLVDRKKTAVLREAMYRMWERHDAASTIQLAWLEWKQERTLRAQENSAAIRIQKIVRRNIAMEDLKRRKFLNMLVESEAYEMQTRKNATLIQTWWRVQLQRKKERKAAYVIQCFLVWVKAEVDREIKKEKKRRKDKKRRKRLKETDDEMLDRIWDKTMGDIPEHPAVKMDDFSSVGTEVIRAERRQNQGANRLAYSSRQMAQSSPRGRSIPRSSSCERGSQRSSSVPKNSGRDGSVPRSSSRDRSMQRSSSRDRSMKRSSSVDRSMKRSSSVDRGTPQNRDSRGRAQRPENRNRLPPARPTIPHQNGLPPVVVRPNDRDDDDHSEVSALTNFSAMYRNPPRRREKMSSRDLDDDFSLEEAWIDTEIHSKRSKQQQQKTKRSYRKS